MRVRLYTSHLSRPIFGPMLEEPDYIEVNNDFSKNKSVLLKTTKIGERVPGPVDGCSNKVSIKVGPHSPYYCCCR